MRETFFDYETRAIVNLCRMPDGEGYWVSRINTPEKHRGKGIARRLMKQMLEEADREGITLYLGISPSGNLDLKELREWYERLGFVQDPRYPNYYESMYRPAVNNKGGTDGPQEQASAPETSAPRARTAFSTQVGEGSEAPSQ